MSTFVSTNEPPVLKLKAKGAVTYGSLTPLQKLIYEHSSIRVTDHGFTLTMPSDRQLALVLHKNDFSRLTPEDNTRVAQALFTFARANNLSSVAPEPIKVRGSEPKPVDPKLDKPKSELEARIKSMASADAQRVAGNNGVEFTPHPTNPGITSMRCKNALYLALRHGKSLLL